MSTRSQFAWPVIDLIEQELLEAASPAADAAAETGPIDTDALFMAQCETFLVREGSDSFVLTLKNGGRVSEIRLAAGVDGEGQPTLRALVD